MHRAQAETAQNRAHHLPLLLLLLDFIEWDGEVVALDIELPGRGGGRGKKRERERCNVNATVVVVVGHQTENAKRYLCTCGSTLPRDLSLSQKDKVSEAFISKRTLFLLPLSLSQFRQIQSLFSSAIRKCEETELIIPFLCSSNGGFQ